MRLTNALAMFAAVGLVACAAETPTEEDNNKTEIADGVTDVVVPTDPGTSSEPAPIDVKCAYPPGSGVAVGQVVPVNTGWDGFRPGEVVPSYINISEFYDCKTTEGVHAIFYDTSQFG
jgi:hypothetical protein